MTPEMYSITEICKRLGVSRHTVAYLCRRGLIPHIKRTRLGYRVFNQDQVDLIAILIKMRAAGFTPAELRQYSRLYRQGKETAEERLAMLTTRKHQLRQIIKDAQASIDFIERQEEIFTQKTN